MRRICSYFDLNDFYPLFVVLIHIIMIHMAVCLRHNILEFEEHLEHDAHYEEGGFGHHHSGL